MERELFALLMRVLLTLPGARTRPPKCTFTRQQVLAVALWAALHDRPISWATKRENWPFHDRRRRLPSNATMSRRLREPRMVELIDELIAALHVETPDAVTLIIDGRPLAIARHSADPDAEFGWALGGKAKGYKLHAIVDSCGNCRAYRLAPLNVSEQAMAREMLAEIDVRGARTLLADANYDANELYEIAGNRGVQMLAERRYSKARGVGHHWHSAHRLRAIELMKDDSEALHGRRFVESCFGTQGNVVGGLGPLPNHVRRLERVRRWVALKLAIDAAHRRRRTERRAA